MTVQANVDFGGPSRAGQNVNVYNHGTQVAATIYDTDGVTPLAQPIPVRGNGHVAFSAAPGTYDVVGSDLTRTVVLAVDATAGVYTRATQPAATGSGALIFVSDDGPGTLFKDTAVGVWTPLHPGEIAYAANVTGTVTTSTNGSIVDVPGVAITVPPSTRPVWLKARGTFQQTVVGTGDVSLYLYETTGAQTLLTNFLQPLPNATTGGCFADVQGEYRLGPVASSRTFKIAAVTIVTAGTPAAKTVNTAANPTALLAEAR